MEILVLVIEGIPQMRHDPATWENIHAFLDREPQELLDMPPRGFFFSASLHGTSVMNTESVENMSSL